MTRDMDEERRSTPIDGDRNAIGRGRAGEPERRSDVQRERADAGDRPPREVGPRSREADAERGDGRGSGDRGWTGRASRWVVLAAGRPTVVGLLTLAVFVIFLVAGLTGAVDFATASLVSTVFSTTITGLFTLVSITVSINQLVLSRIIGSPEHIRRRMDSVSDFRGEIVDENDRVSVAPTEPAAFLEVVTRALRDRALRLGDVYDRRNDPRLRHDVERLVEDLVGLAEQVDDEIGTKRLLLIDVLLPVLDDRYSRYVHAVDRVRETTDDLSAAERRALGELRSVLQDVNLTRHYFKTLFLHEALASLSKRMLATGVPAVLLSYLVILAYGGGPPLAGTARTVAVSAAIALAIVPLSVLFAYGIRVAAIASRTTTFGTFTPVEELP